MNAFHQILDELVEEDSATAAIFADDSGETVDMSTADGSEETRLVAAYAGIYLRQSERFCMAEKVGGVRSISIDCEGLHLTALRLKDGYSLILLSRGVRLEAVSRRRLEVAAEKIEKEAFG